MESIKPSSTSILSKFDEHTHHLSTDITSVKDLLQEILHSNEKHFSHSDFLHHHPRLIVLRDWYLNLLQQWRNEQQFDDITGYVFETIPHLFLKISNYISEDNINILKELICYQPILDQFNFCLEQITTNGKYLSDPHIRSLDNLFRAIQRLARNRFETKIDPLFDQIVKCICSPSFLQLFLHSTTQDTDDPGQKFLLHTCTDYIYSHPTDQTHKQSLLDIRHSLLRPFAQWFSQQSSSFRSWNHRLSITLRQLCFILTLSIQHNRTGNLDRPTFDYYCQLADSFVNILYSILQSEQTANPKLIQSLLVTITPNLYTMILSSQLEKYLKNKHITSLIVKLIDIENDEIQLNAFRILAVILTEQDTKILSHSMNIAHLFWKFLTKIIDDENQILRFSNLLHCLKDIIHYDQIKEEFTKQNGIPLLLRCATEMKFKPLQAQQPALEILLALTFHKQAYRQLREHVNQLRLLLSSPHPGVSRVVHCLLWRFEKFDESKISSNNCQYDFMISYSHSNKDLVDRISDQLLKDNFRVYIDYDQTFGATKAEIMDQSRYILLCLSDEYKQNSFCRCEAYYAYERQYQIIPLILTFNFHLDGWLMEIIQGKIYIDFIKLDFDLAYYSLKSEINRDDLYTKIEPSIGISRPKMFSRMEYSSDMKQWTVDEVKLFLMENQFDCLIPVISDMNGCLLYDLYTMCKENRESMFHTLKNEVVIFDRDVLPLTIFTYLRFLREIEKFISITH